MKRKATIRASPASEGQAQDGRVPPSAATALVEAFLTNERINQVLLGMLDPGVWRAPPPCTQRRTIASTFAHIHNVRCMMARAAKARSVPPKLERASVTTAEARAALTASAKAIADVLAEACARGGKVRGHPLDAAGFLCACLTHEAHHRGQICHWARTLGAPIQDQLQLWEWHKRQREVAQHHS